MSTAPFSITVPGYPRVAAGRVYNSLLEKFWSQKISESEFETVIETPQDGCVATILIA